MRFRHASHECRIATRMRPEDGTASRIQHMQVIGFPAGEDDTGPAGCMERCAPRVGPQYLSHALCLGLSAEIVFPNRFAREAVRPAHAVCQEVDRDEAAAACRADGIACADQNPARLRQSTVVSHHVAIDAAEIGTPVQAAGGSVQCKQIDRCPTVSHDKEFGTMYCWCSAKEDCVGSAGRPEQLSRDGVDGNEFVARGPVLRVAFTEEVDALIVSRQARLYGVADRQFQLPRSLSGTEIVRGRRSRRLR